MTKTLLQAKVVDIEKRRYPSKHYVYVIEVSWSEGSQTVIYRRYSAFFEFQCGLLERFPVEAGAKNPVDRCIPFLPGKKLFGRSHVRTVAEKRMGPINEYCQTLIHLPSSISDGDYVKNFFEITPEDINPPIKKEKKKSVDTANEISDPVLLEQFTAVADYKRQKNTECDLTAGQIVEVIDKNENGWWFVHLDDLNEGWVPATYLESVYGRNTSASPIILNPGEEEMFITTSDYKAKNSDELTFEKGVLVEVFQKGLDGWWKGRYQNKDGYVPACYLFRYYGPIGSPEGIEIVSTAQDAVDSIQRASSLADTSRSKSPRLNPTKPQRSRGTFSIAGIKLKPGVDPYANEPIYAPTPRKETVQAQKGLSRPPVVSKLQQFSSSNSFDSDDLDEHYAKPDVLFGTKSPDSSFDGDSLHDYETLSEHYMTIGDFEAQVSDGLSFKQGEQVSVITKNPSGWWFVEAGKDEGWVPSSYLEKVYKPHEQKMQDQPQSVKPKAKPPPPVRKDVNKTSPEMIISKPHEEKETVKPKAKPPPPVRKDIGVSKPAIVPISSFNTKQDDSTTKSKSKPPPPIRKDVNSSSTSKSNGGDDTRRPNSPPAPNKPKLLVAKKSSVGPRKSNEGESSVAAMAALISQGLNKPVNRQSSLDNGNQETHHLSISKKPVVPQRVPVKLSSSVEVRRESLKRSSSSDSIREIERPPDTRLSKSPHPSRPLSKQVSETKPVKFLRKSTENLLAAQAEEENRLSVAPKPAPRKSFSSSKDHSPVASRRTHTISNPNLSQSKPVPPGRNHIPPSNNQTLKLAGLEKALKSKKTPPSRPVKKVVGATGVVKKPSPQRPNYSPNKAKKTPPPRPSNSPAGSRKITYVTIADYCGYDDSSLSFSEGESVKVLEKNPEGWWFVEIGGNEGWVPSTFIEMTSAKPERPGPPIKKPTPAARPKPPPPVKKDNMFRAIADYTTPVYEDSGMNLVENEAYEVLEKSDGGWWFIKRGEEEGWAPSSFLESL